MVKEERDAQGSRYYDKESIKVYEDRAYGQIKLVTPDGQRTGKDMVAVSNIVVFGPYYIGTTKINVPYKLIE